MKSTLVLSALLGTIAACSTTTTGEGTSTSSSTSSSSGSSSGGSSSGSSTTSSSGTSGTSTSSSGGSVSTAQCQSTCVTKVYQCNPDPPPDVASICQDICSSGSYSQAQMDCFKNASCESFQSANYIEDVCPP